MAKAQSSRDRAPLSVELCDVACAGFAVWTVAANAVVALGGNLYHLLLAFPAFLAALGAGVAAWRRFRPRPVAPPVAPPPPRPEAGPGLGAVRALGAAAGLLLLARHATALDAVEFWWFAVGLLGLAAPFVLRASPGPPAPPLRDPRAEALLWTLGLACVALTLVTHRFDSDDSFYVNLAVAAADEPGRVLLAFDTLRGVEGLPFSNPTQRAQSYELLNGAIAFLTGIPAIACFHWISAALAAVWVPLAYARLFRLLAPSVWPWAVVAVVVLLVSWGGTHRSYGNFSFVRLWQGKAIFLCAVLPLVYAYALRFARAPAPGRFALLAASQIAAVGLTSSALWAAPLSAALGLAAAVSPDLRGARTLGIGLLASAYTLGVALLLKGQVPAELVTTEGLETPGQQLYDALATVVGRGGLHYLGVGSVLLTWAALRPGLAQRFAVVVPLGALLVVANPYTESLVRANVTGPTQWRSLWALPAPLLATLLCCAPLQLGGSRLWRVGGRVLCAAALLGCVLWLPRRTTLTPRPGFLMGPPALKVNPVPYGWARRIQQSVPPGSNVLAPASVNPWIPTLHDHPYPLEVRPDFHWDMNREDAYLRFALTRFVTGDLRVDGAPQLLRLGIRRYGLEAVCLLDHPGAEEVRAVLREADFRRVGSDGVFELWLPGPTAAQRGESGRG